MLLTDYVASYAEIRALLGVNDEELEDATLGLRVFVRSLEEGLNEIDEAMGQSTGALIGAFKTVTQIANADRTATQQRFFDNVQTYASYHVAVDLTESLPMFAPRSITDGKAAVQRYSDTVIADMIAAVKGGKARATARLKRAFQLQLGLTPSSSLLTPGTLMAVSTPDSDPVTGT